jgi:uncharacterized surface protein with fasciclin (FAS1) repeats
MHAVASTPHDIVDTAARASSLQAFSSAITVAGLLQRLRGGGPFTVFAPTDDAFSRIAEHTLQCWLRPGSKVLLMGIMTYHVLAGRLPMAEIIRSSSVPTLHGTSLTIRFAAGRMHVNNAAVIQPDIGCSNGMIHIIDTVVIPR